jgi:hypothetical protein
VDTDRPTFQKSRKKQDVTVKPEGTKMGTETGQFYYAGVGSRETPKHIMQMMNEVARYLESEDWILRSGAAEGADTAFEEGIHDEAKEIYLPWSGYNNSKSELNPKNYPFTQVEQDLTAHFHPAWNKCSPSARLLHCRNTRIVLGLEDIHGPHVQPSRFIVCWTVKGMVTGGTGQALRIAKSINVPIINFGKATSTKELEKQLLELDDIQGKIRA